MEDDEHVLLLEPGPEALDDATLLAALRKYFGHTSFRGHQKDIIRCGPRLFLDIAP